MKKEEILEEMEDYLHLKEKKGVYTPEEAEKIKKEIKNLEIKGDDVDSLYYGIEKKVLGEMRFIKNMATGEYTVA